MRKHSRNLFPPVVTLGLIGTAILFVGLGTAVAQRKGNGGGGGTSTQTGWIEQFNDGDITKRGWGIEHTGAVDSQFGVPGVGVAKSFDRENVAIAEGILNLKLNLTYSGGTWTSNGALVYTKQTYGYGTYEWCMRKSSTATSPTALSTPDLNKPPSGGVSASFVYVNNSQTEIDFEQAAAKDISGSNGILYWWLYMANWANLRPTYTRWKVTEISGNPNPPYAEFKTYKFDWKKDYVEFLVNGTKVAFHTQNVPRTAAYVLMNHWGTNSPDGFGGPAEAGERYFYVDWVRYTPPGAQPQPVSGGSKCPGSAP